MMNTRAGIRYSRRDFSEFSVFACRFARANEDVKCTKRLALAASSARASARASDIGGARLGPRFKLPRQHDIVKEVVKTV